MTRYPAEAARTVRCSSEAETRSTVTLSDAGGAPAVAAGTAATGPSSTTVAIGSSAGSLTAASAAA